MSEPLFFKVLIILIVFSCMCLSAHGDPPSGQGTDNSPCHDKQAQRGDAPGVHHLPRLPAHGPLGRDGWWRVSRRDDHRSGVRWFPAVHDRAGRDQDQGCAPEDRGGGGTGLGDDVG